MINPWLSNNIIDSCAFDPKYAPEDVASDEIFRLHSKNGLLLIIAHSTLKEIDHLHTPSWVKKEANKHLYTLQVQLTQDEIKVLQRIELILAGNGKVENIVQDARHIFEAQKYGSFFITTDARLLKRLEELRQEFTVQVLKPSAFLNIAQRKM